MVDPITGNNPGIKTFTASDGYQLHYRHWVPQTAQPVGYVIALHGIQSHSGWYEYSSQRLCEAGYDVRFMDRRGSGLNEGDRGHTDDYERLTNDVVQFANHVQHEQQKPDSSSSIQRRPLTLLAVSWGAKIASVVAAQRPQLVERLVLLYPGLRPSINPKWHQLRLLNLATAIGKARRMVHIPLDDPALFTSSKTAQEFINADPYALHSVSVAFLQAGRKLDRIIEQSAADISCPTLLALAGKDQIIDNAGTAELFQRFGATTRKMIEYPNCEHTLEFEPDREQIFDELVAWLKSPE